MKGCTIILGAVGLLLVAGAALADQVTLPAVKDNTLYQDATGQTSNGAGDYIFTGKTDKNLVRRAVLAFDITGNIPAGATINTVTLQLYRSRGKETTDYDVSLHRILQDWGEGASNADAEEGEGTQAVAGDATWLHTFYPGMFWNNAGGDYVATTSATTPVGKNGFYTWSDAGMVANVQAWLDSAGTNFGWVVIGDESVSRSSKRFESRTNGTVSRRPQLTIDYTPGAIPSGACCLPNDSCAVLTEANCLAQSGVYQGDGVPCTPSPCVVPTGACCFADAGCDTLSEADCIAQNGTYQGDDTICSADLCPLILEAFVDSLPRPAVAVPVSGNPGETATYDMVIQQVTQQLHRDLPPTTVWGYAGSYPGPTIEASTDQPITVNWINDLRDTAGVLRTNHYLPVDLCMHGPNTEGSTPRTVTHLHGGHVPPEVDGYPEATFLPGESETYVYPNNQPAATLWYHDHALGITRLNVMMGMAGFYLVRDETEEALALPEGEFEIAMVIQDRKFNPDGSLVYPAIWEEHFFGDKALVNGKVWPYLNVKQGKYRFRLLNGSNSRVYELRLSTGDPFFQIGTDGGLLAAPVRRDTLVISPGERADIIVDFEGYPLGTEIILENSAVAPYPSGTPESVIPEIMKFIVANEGGYTAAMPDTLRPFEILQEADASQIRNLELRKYSDPCAGSIWLINGLGWDDITERPYLDSTEVWTFINRSGTVHPMHMHLVFFQILNRQNFEVIGEEVVPIGTPTPPDSGDAGWKDTVPVYPDEMVRVIARFEDYTGLYPYHCHILEHEDHEMMRQFEVLAGPVAITDAGPITLQLSPAKPNPFGPSTTIQFTLPQRSTVSMNVFDVAGREVRTLASGDLPAGPHTIRWDGMDDAGQALRTGIYIVRLQVGSEVLSQKMTLVR